MTPQRQHAVHDPLHRRGDVLRLHHHRSPAERHDAEVVRRPERHRGRGHSARRQRLAAHRPAAVDQQAHRRARLHPPPDPQSLRIHQRCCRPRFDDGFAAGVDVEIAAGDVERRGDDAARPAPARRTTSRHVEHEPGGELPRQLPQPCIRRPRHVSQQRHRRIGIDLDRGRRTPTRRAHRHTATPRRTGVGGRGPVGTWSPVAHLRWRPPPPAPPSGREGPHRGRCFSRRRLLTVRTGSGDRRTPRARGPVMISSAVCWAPSRNRTRPDSATSTASRPTAVLVAG